MKKFIREGSVIAIILGTMVCVALIIGCCNGIFGYHEGYGIYLRQQCISSDVMLAGEWHYENANLNLLDMIVHSIKYCFAI